MYVCGIQTRAGCGNHTSGCTKCDVNGGMSSRFARGRPTHGRLPELHGAPGQGESVEHSPQDERTPPNAVARRSGVWRGRRVASVSDARRVSRWSVLKTCPGGDPAAYVPVAHSVTAVRGVVMAAWRRRLGRGRACPPSFEDSAGDWLPTDRCVVPKPAELASFRSVPDD